MAFVPTNASVNSKLHKFSTLSRQVSVDAIFSIKFDFFKIRYAFYFLIVSRNLQCTQWKYLPIVHSFPFYTVIIWMPIWNLKLTKVCKMEKKFIMNFISTLLMRTIRWCVSFTINTLVLFQFYWHVFLFVCLSQSLVKYENWYETGCSERTSNHVCIGLVLPLLLVWFIFFA